MSAPGSGLTRTAGLVLVDRALDLHTPSLHTEHLLDRVFGMLPRRGGDSRSGNQVQTDAQRRSLCKQGMTLASLRMPGLPHMLRPWELTVSPSSWHGRQSWQLILRPLLLTMVLQCSSAMYFCILQRKVFMEALEC